MPVYQKLVRDCIPKIIEQSGKAYKIERLDEKEYTLALQKKLQEEVKEYLEAEHDAHGLEELADILELLHGLAKTHDATIERVEEIRQEKARSRGSFDERIFLIEVED
ncbi:nucleoside triphosphate pyrophosphohydrolase [Radiobacillus deserti]|uniref:Phosphoribosyl-ATP pyrophosphohydrolase n=1 Tax=Radiobacillus deserti TaxID=2594883 RepID=A0A516KDL3_9BACI|nr:nucleoside triphosphate pyrophosphohydrolase [Radiobacillus deserti]QDP39502.1 phosphoribosyl-ATP pyrophosphohydrolase [Radiobacillus deserti]